MGTDGVTGCVNRGRVKSRFSPYWKLTDTADGYYKNAGKWHWISRRVQKLSEALRNFVRNTQNSTQSLKMQLLQLQGDTEGTRNAERASIRDAERRNPAKAQLSALKEQQAAAQQQKRSSGSSRGSGAVANTAAAANRQRRQ